MLRLNARTYRLRLQVQTDSSQLLKPAQPVDADSVAVGTKPNGDLILAAKQFYNIRYTITLLDSAGRRQFRRTFTKPDFYAVAGRQLVVESEPLRPVFIGYNAPRQWLLFRQEFEVDGTDWGGEAFLALDLKGQIKRLTPSNSYGGGGSDCRIQQSPDGQAVITCEELLLPGGRHQRLARPNGRLTAARFLSDTTLLATYDFVKTQRVKIGESWTYDEVPIPRYRNAPNAFILSARTGKELARFRYDGVFDVLGYHLPGRYVWQTATYYLLDENRHSLRIIPKYQPQRTQEIRLAQLARFQAPQLPSERKLRLGTESMEIALYIDAVTGKLRLQPVASGE